MSDYTRCSWDELRTSGLLWFVNRTLHLFGYALIYEKPDHSEPVVYLARTSVRGFSLASEERGYTRLTEFMRDNSTRLVADIEGERLDALCEDIRRVQDSAARMLRGES